jgi:HSP20 family protein
MTKTGSDQPIGNLGQKMVKLMDQLQKGYYNFCPSETWTPSVNLYEAEQTYLVCVDLAGVDKDKIDVEVTDQQLTLRGTRTVPAHSEDLASAGGQRLRVHLMEIDHGPFCRVVELPPDVAEERIVANYRNGMLWIELPKQAAKAKAPPKRIET